MVVPLYIRRLNNIQSRVNYFEYKKAFFQLRLYWALQIRVHCHVVPIVHVIRLYRHINKYIEIMEYGNLRSHLSNQFKAFFVFTLVLYGNFISSCKLLIVNNKMSRISIQFSPFIIFAEYLKYNQLNFSRSFQI